MDIENQENASQIHLETLVVIQALIVSMDMRLTAAQKLKVKYDWKTKSRIERSKIALTAIRNEIDRALDGESAQQIIPIS